LRYAFILKLTFSQSSQRIVLMDRNQENAQKFTGCIAKHRPNIIKGMPQQNIASNNVMALQWALAFN